MIEPETFDAFYRDARSRLLFQAYALTGDLTAARSAVRDSFIVTWHHWRKVGRLPDPEAWVRPRAWAQAQRRHTARIWHRDKGLDPQAAATFDALGSLSSSERKALVLDRCTVLPLADRARELGLPVAEADLQTSRATTRFLEHRGVPAEAVPELFAQLEALTVDSRLPRTSIIRRSGAARRRAHTAVGAAAAVVALVASGVVVSGSTLEGVRPEVRLDTPTAPDDIPEVELTADHLLTASAVGSVVTGRGWVESGTSDNSGGNGRVAPCQQARYADPRGESRLLRTFETKAGKRDPVTTAVQYAELSATPRASRRAWDRVVGWYGGCVTPRVQLISTHDVLRVGDGAKLFHLRSWRGGGATYVVGVARTGKVVTTTLVQTPAGDPPDLRDAALLLGESVDGLCATRPGATCSSRPTTRAVRPVRAGEVPSLLIEADLPPVSGVTQPWVGTKPRQARSNTAATRCDRADFSARGISKAVTRTFLVPRAEVSAAFGITETVGTMRTDQARTFVRTVRDRMASCADRDLGSDVVALASFSDEQRDFSVWRVTSELSDDSTVTYLMGIVRDGTAVGQVGFVPSGGVSMAPGAFDTLVRRALARLHYQPAP